jgi:hypothetical protein
MQAVFERIWEISYPWIIPFPEYMGTPASFPPHPNEQSPQAGYVPQKHGNWAQWVSPAVTLLIGIVSVSIMVHYRNADTAARSSDEHVNGLIDAKLNPFYEQLRGLSQQVGVLQGQISQLNENQRKLTNLQVDSINSRVESARSTKSIGPKEVSKIGKSLISLSESNDSGISTLAWNALVNLLSYRSFLNVENSPAAHEKFGPTLPGKWEITARFDVHIKKGEGPGSATATFPNKLVPGSQSFIYEPLNIGEIPVREGHAFVRMTAEGPVRFAIDGYRLRNVIFDGVTIEYDGGPLIMENVYFVNCTFEVKPTNSTRQFTLAVLQSVPTSFSVSYPSTHF